MIIGQKQFAFRKPVYPLRILEIADDEDLILSALAGIDTAILFTHLPLPTLSVTKSIMGLSQGEEFPIIRANRLLAFKIRLEVDLVAARRVWEPRRGSGREAVRRRCVPSEGTTGIVPTAEIDLLQEFLFADFPLHLPIISQAFHVIKSG